MNGFCPGIDAARVHAAVLGTSAHQPPPELGGGAVPVVIEHLDATTLKDAAERVARAIEYMLAGQRPRRLAGQLPGICTDYWRSCFRSIERH